MKEATGELNMTVITIVAVAAIAAFFYLLIWPTIQTSMSLNTACNAAGSGDYETSGGSGSSEYTITCKNGTCTYKDKNGSESTKTCSS